MPDQMLETQQAPRLADNDQTGRPNIDRLEENSSYWVCQLQQMVAQRHLNQELKVDIERGPEDLLAWEGILRHSVFIKRRADDQAIMTGIVRSSVADGDAVAVAEAEVLDTQLLDTVGMELYFFVCDERISVWRVIWPSSGEAETEIVEESGAPGVLLQYLKCNWRSLDHRGGRVSSTGAPSTQ